MNQLQCWATILLQYLMFAKSGEGLTIRLRRNAFQSMLKQVSSSNGYV